MTGSPPVTTPDSVSVFQGGFAEVQPVNNDHDPDNDQLAICRLGTEHYRGLQAIFVGNDWAVLARPKAKPGTYTFTYYACDFSYLTPGTITVTVEAVPKIKVKKIASKPGHLRVTNPADVKIRFLYGSFKEDRPDGSLTHRQGLLGRDRRPPHPDRLDRHRPQGRALLRHRSRQRHQAGRAAPRPAGQVALPSRLAQLWRSRLALLAGTAALLLVTPAAYAATGSPPVTIPTASRCRGRGASSTSTANDSDPDGDALEVCRLGRVPRARSAAHVQGGDLVVLPSRRAHGTYTLTYYVCDQSYLTAGTVTIKVSRPPRPSTSSRSATRRPGGWLVNTYKHRTFHCQWGRISDKASEGRAP